MSPWAEQPEGIGIPAIMPLADATTRVNDGQIVTLDGSADTVTAQGWAAGSQSSTAKEGCDRL